MTSNGNIRHELQIEALPARHTKVVHLIRHGEGFHNVAGRQSNDNYLSYDYLDSHLNAFGWQQAEALQRHMGTLQPSLPIDLVVCSPLTRTLETAVGAFGRPARPDQGEEQLLMRAQSGEQGKRAERSAMFRADCPPIIALELCREHLGKHPCDKRRTKSHYEQQFPGVDFSLVETEEDVQWQPDERESADHIRARGLQLAHWLMQRPEQHIAVVTHSSFLYFMLDNFGRQAAPAAQKELHRWFQNCELRSIVLSDPSGAAAAGEPDAAWFPGGSQLSRQGAKVPEDAYLPPEAKPQVITPAERAAGAQV